MFRDLETERLLLKRIGYDDTAFFFREFSNDDVNRYLYDAEPCASEEDAREWTGFFPEPEPRDRQRWVLVLKESGEKIGTCGFHCRNGNTRETEMGYDLLPSYWRKGYMTEALREIIRFAADEMGVQTVFAHISTENTDSVKTAEKLGFAKTGKRYFEEFHGRKYPHDIYALSLKKTVPAAEVRLGTPADLPSWMELVREIRWNFPGLETEESVKEHEQTVLKFMTQSRALCVTVRDKVAGVLLFSRKHNMICCLAVKPEYRKRGIASALMKKALNELDRSRDIVVSTFREDDEKGRAPRALYQKFGFTEGELTEEFGYPCQVFTLPKNA